MTVSKRDYKDRSWILAIIGAGLLLVGVVAAAYAPAEVLGFAFFAEGGRFAYEGFGFGSLMFAVIAWQIIAYAGIALVFIPLGCAHLRLRRWARPLMVSLLWLAWILGVPLLVVFVFLLSFKALSSAAGWVVLVAVGLAYLFLPGLLIRFYESEDVRRTFAAKDPRSYAIERLPVPLLVLAILLLFCASALHLPLFFQALFPCFGRWLSGSAGVLALAMAIITLVALAWGVWQQRLWAWWGSLSYFVLLTLSAALTLVRSSRAEIVSRLQLPPMETEILRGMTLQRAHLLALVGIPLLLTLALLVRSRRHFE